LLDLGRASAHSGNVIPVDERGIRFGREVGCCRPPLSNPIAVR